MTHPFHPLYKKKYQVVTLRQNWGMNLVYYYDSKKRLKSISTDWTSLKPKDPFWFLAKGRSDFRFTDLVKLSQLIEQIKQKKDTPYGNI